ncbi:MAG: Ig-like domain-containing protein, partial [Ruminococcus sp.]|nr:Ig-like domain-containing protein [Ruminococcus sp.]
MTKRIMIIVLYVIAAAIMLLSGLCLIGLTQSLHISKPEPVFTTTEPTVTEESFIMKQNEPTVIHIKKENEDKLLSWESSDESIVEVDSGGRLDAYTTGVAEITARYKDGSETVYTVTVEEAEKKPERNIFSTAITANEDILERNELGNQDLYHILVNREQNIVT